MTEPDPTPAASHLDPFEIAGYVGSTLSREDRLRVEHHLADCEPCTEEVVAVARLGRSRRSLPWLPWAAVAAAVLAGIVVLWPRGTPPGGDILRDGAAGDTIAVVAPANRALVTGSPTLIWRGVPRVAAYRITVTSADGDSLWAVQTTDTAVTLPAELVTDSGVTRHWYVDALLSDGSSISSGMREFRTGP